MAEEMVVYGAESASVKLVGRNTYRVSTAVGTANLKRDVDFGVIPGTKKPSLYKAGAEKLCLSYGLLTHMELVDKIEDAEKPFFMYTFKCSLVKIAADGREYVFSTAYGSANTAERRNGRNSPYDAANATLKMAQKRALVSAAISLSGLSDMFTQDMDNEDYTEAVEKKELTADAPITGKQQKALFAVGAQHGKSREDVLAIIKAAGFSKANPMKQSDYDKIFEAVIADGESEEK